MEGGNFRIKSSWLQFHVVPVGTNMYPMTDVQMNQYVNYAGNMNLWGTIYATKTFGRAVVQTLEEI